MKISDIVSEARKQPSMPGMSLKQRVSPDVINMLMYKHQYDKEIATAKAANAAANPEKKTPKPPQQPSDDPLIRLYGNFMIKASHIQDWIDNHNENLALKRASKWPIFKNVPKHVLDDIMSDVDVKQLILNIWDIATLFLKMYNMHRPNFNYRFPLERLGEDPYLDKNDIHYLARTITAYRKKYNIDITGKQLGNVSHWAR